MGRQSGAWAGRYWAFWDFGLGLIVSGHGVLENRVSWACDTILLIDAHICFTLLVFIFRGVFE